MTEYSQIEDHLNIIQNNIKRLENAVSGDQKMGQPGLVTRVETLERMFEEVLKMMKDNDKLLNKLTELEKTVEKHDRVYTFLETTRLHTGKGWLIFITALFGGAVIINRLGGVEAVFQFLMGIV